MYRAVNIFSGIITFAVLVCAVFSFESSGQNKGGDLAVAEELNRQAILKVSAKEYSAAIELLDRALAERPDFSSGHLNLGSAYLLSGKPEVALRHIQKGLELNPLSHTGYNQLGVTYESLGKSDRAVEAFQKAISLKPDYAFGYYNLGCTYLWADKIKLARAALEKALEIDPKSSEAKLFLGIVLARQNKYSDAVAQVKKVTATEPNNDLANLILCQIYLYGNDRQSALNMYQSFKSVNVPLADAMFRSIFADKVVFATPDPRP